MYNPITGQQQLWYWNAASKTWGLFAEDTWKARRNLTLTLGFRYDDQGNPYSRSDTTVFGNFYLGSRVPRSRTRWPTVLRRHRITLSGSPQGLHPRIGAAWDITGKGDWVLRGGFGMYSNWLTPANIQEEFRGNPPGLILPTFFANSASPPIFTQGSGNKPPFGFTFPALAGTALCPVAPCLDAAGGIPGAQPGIGGIDPEHRFTDDVCIFRQRSSIGWAATSSPASCTADRTPRTWCRRQPGGQVNYGQDINALPGDLIGKPPGSAPTRLNPSFGPIGYTQNDRFSNYNGITFDLRGRFRRGVLRRFVYSLRVERRCRCLSDRHQSRPVLRPFAVGCA